MVDDHLIGWFWAKGPLQLKSSFRIYKVSAFQGYTVGSYKYHAHGMGNIPLSPLAFPFLISPKFIVIVFTVSITSLSISPTYFCTYDSGYLLGLAFNFHQLLSSFRAPPTPNPKSKMGLPLLFNNVMLIICWLINILLWMNFLGWWLIFQQLLGQTSVSITSFLYLFFFFCGSWHVRIRLEIKL